MKLLISLVFIMGTLSTTLADVRTQIGPVINAPLAFEKNLYFLATTGVLYQSDPLMTKTKILFQTKKSSVSPLTIKDSILYFGEGLHDDLKSNFYAYDLKNHKIKFTLPLEGHIERAPLITKDKIYIGLGPAGIAAIDIKTNKTLWVLKKITEGELHIDSTPVLYKEIICVASIYRFKGIVCLKENKDNGVEKDFAIALDKNPKSEIRTSLNLLYGTTTDATMVETKWKNPGALYVIDLEQKKKTLDLPLTGYNFFAPTKISSEEIFLGLSTGDLLQINLNNGKITFVGEMKAPVVSSVFIKHGSYCAISIDGKMLCYQKIGKEFQQILEQKWEEVMSGVIAAINGTFYIPTRIGYKLL